jgi:hypothetical protein
MDLSDRDRRVLGEIEQQLRADRGFARRMDGLSAACGRTRGRFACRTTRWELLCVLFVVVVLSTLPVLMVLAAGRATTPAAPPATTPALTGTG